MSGKVIIVSWIGALGILLGAGIAAAQEPQPGAPDAPASPAAVITVNTVSDVFANDGLCTLREAIQSVNASMSVGGCVSGGLGKDTITITATGVITLSSALPAIFQDVDIVGPGAGVLTISGASLYRVMQVNAGTRVSLSGVTIANGFASVTGGGGILNSGTMTLTDSTVFRNAASVVEGGGIYNDGELMINNSRIYSNSATDSGGGIYNEGSGLAVGALTIMNSEILSNSAGNVGGAGLLNFGGIAILSNTLVSANTAGGYGAGLYVQNGDLHLINSTVSRNDADRGGGLYSNYTGTVTIVGSTFYRNRAVLFNGGGVDIAESGKQTYAITNSTFVSNTSQTSGGGIFVTTQNTVLTIVNSTFSANKGSSGGSILVNLGSVTLKNTVVANSPGVGNCSGTITDGGNNLQYGGTVANSCGASIATADPKLGLPGPHGGNTDTMALLVGSAAIDAGNPATCAATDQRGVARPLGLACDIGAYEGTLGPVYLPVVAR